MVTFKQLGLRDHYNLCSGSYLDEILDLKRSIAILESVHMSPQTIEQSLLFLKQITKTWFSEIWFILSQKCKIKRVSKIGRLVNV